ncbi:MAG: inositol monophosphatase [Myxococcales bacterium]|nr:inositol monophosphatase [Myxococcales bacterium]
MSASPDELRRIAEEAARLAGKVLVDRLKGERTIDRKREIDLVTDADRASEAELLEFLRARRPGDAVLAEESGAFAGGGLRWLVDPLDGTANYARGIPIYSVSVAVEDADGLLAGAVFDPSQGELFSAARGRGATLNGSPIRASAVDKLEQAALCIGFPYDLRLRPEPTVTLFERMAARCGGILRTGSAALNLAYVACGRFDGHFQLGVSAWDIAAGALLAREAGGEVCCLDGAPLDLSAGDVLASNRALFPALCAECGAALGEAGWERRG